MNVGSLFSGIGGLDEGLRRAGWEHAWLAESDPYRRNVLRARFPGVPVYEDVREVATGRRGRPIAGVVGGNGPRSDGRLGRTWAENSDARVDLVCGGFPCQDVSVAGRRAGLAGERSGLFHEFARVVDAVRPRWVLVENVPGLLSSNGGRDFGCVLGTLADIGYGLAWRIVDSRYFGVPQRRRRVFIVGALATRNHRAVAERAGQVLAVATRCDRHPPTGATPEENVAVSAPLGTGGAGKQGWRDDLDHGAYVMLAADVRRLTPVECERLQALPDGWTDLGQTSDSKRYAALGDAVTVAVAEWIGRRMLA